VMSEVKTSSVRTCSVAGCTDSLFKIGYCVKHYQEYSPAGSPAKVTHKTNHFEQKAADHVKVAPKPKPHSRQVWRSANVTSAPVGKFERGPKTVKYKDLPAKKNIGDLP